MTTSGNNYLEFTCKACKLKHRATLTRGGIIVAAVLPSVEPSANNSNKMTTNNNTTTTTTIPLTYTCPEKDVSQVYNYSVPSNKAKEYEDVEISDVQVIHQEMENRSN